MRATIASIASLLLGVAFLISGHGLQLTLIPLRATAEGWTPFEIGLIGSAYYVGFVVGCIGSPAIILRAGHIRAQRLSRDVTLGAASRARRAPAWS
jgi:hypothetical protein